MLTRRIVWPAICAAVLTATVVRGDLAELYAGQWRAAWDWDLAARLDAARAGEPDYVLTGPQPAPDLREASLDSLGGPRVLPPPLCGRYAVPGIWSATPTWTFAGIVQNGAGGTLSVTKVNPAWQALLGTNTYTGTTKVDQRGTLTVKAPASQTWLIGDGGLLCVDGDLVADADSPYTLGAAARLTYTDGTGIAWIDGTLTVTSGAAITVQEAPPYHPITLLEATGGIFGTFALAAAPAGWVLLHDSHFVRLDYQP